MSVVKFGKMLLMSLLLNPLTLRAETLIDFVGNKVVVEQNGVKTVVEIDKKLLTSGDSDVIVAEVLKKLKESK